MKREGRIALVMVCVLAAGAAGVGAEAEAQAQGHGQEQVKADAATIVPAPAPAAPAPTPSLKPPVLSDTLRARFFKAQAQVIRADQEFQDRKKELMSAVEALAAACGEGFEVQMSAEEDPVCALKTVGREGVGAPGAAGAGAAASKPK